MMLRTTTNKPSQAKKSVSIPNDKGKGRAIVGLLIIFALLIAALAYVGFQFLRVDIPVGTERTAIHLGNAFVVLGALLLFMSILIANRYSRHIFTKSAMKAFREGA